jgi:putative salt-induced outer membrane protein YdiY
LELRLSGKFITLVAPTLWGIEVRSSPPALKTIGSDANLKGRKMPMRRSLFSVAAVLFLGPNVRADQVTLKNGDHLSGKIVSGDGKVLVLKSEFAGDVTIQWGAVTGIESTDSINITLKDGTRLSGKVTTQDGKFVVAGAPPGAPPAAAKETIVAVRNEEEQRRYETEAEKVAHPRFYYFWSGFFDTGLALTRGNSQTASFTMSTKEVRETPRDKITVYGNYIFANNGSIPPAVTTANALDAGLRGDLNISPRFFVFATTDFQTNELQHLDLRSVFGGGVGYHVFKTPETTLDVFAGVTYDHDSFGSYPVANPTPPPAFNVVPSSSRTSAEALIGEEFDKKLSSRSALTERFSFFSNLSHTGDYRFQLDSNIATKVKTWLSWQVTLSDRYISYPPVTLKANDLLLSTGLRVIWGKSKL